MIKFLLVLQVVIALTTLLSKNIYTSVVLLAVFSLISSLLFFILHAPDVALTEAAVGAGISTFLFIWAIKKTNAKG